MWRRIVVGLSAVAFLNGTALAQGNNPGCVGDLDGNFEVNLEDLLHLLTLYGLGCVPIEPPSPASSAMAISEIMYNPSSEQGNDSDFEFLELHNTDSFAVDISGWQITNAVQFTFPEGTWVPPFGFVAIVRNLEAMSAWMPPDVLAFQWNSGESLNNTGENIELIRNDGSEADEVSYEDNDGWVNQPDGGGPSLEWIDPGLNNDFPDAWTFSMNLGGTPGGPNSMWGLADPE